MDHRQPQVGWKIWCLWWAELCQSARTAMVIVNHPMKPEEFAWTLWTLTVPCLNNQLSHQNRGVKSATMLHPLSYDSN
jgi:hypothetical protein